MLLQHNKMNIKNWENNSNVNSSFITSFFINDNGGGGSGSGLLLLAHLA